MDREQTLRAAAVMSEGFSEYIYELLKNNGIDPESEELTDAVFALRKERYEASLSSEAT